MGKENGTSEAPETPPKDPAAGPPSLLNVIMLYLCLVGLGVIGGYGAFYFMFSQRCVNLLAESEAHYNATKEEWQSRYLDAVADKEQCLTPLYQAQGQLEAQSTVAERYQALLVKQEETLAKLSALQETKEESGDTLTSLRSQIGQLELELETAVRKLGESEREKHRVEQELLNEVQQARDVVSQRERELVEVREYQDFCAARIPALEAGWQKTKDYIQERANRLCRMEYGNGPFFIEFVLQFPDDEETASFQIELAPLSDMPHTVFVFMELLTFHLFDGTTILGADGRFVEGGNPTNTIDSAQAVRLSERYAKFGYQPPLAFGEYSPNHPHKEFTIGFVDDGPTFAINMIDNSRLRGPEERNDPCFGKVVSGFETLTRLQNASKEDNGYELVHPVEIVRVQKVQPE